MSLIFDILLLGAAKALLPKEPKLTNREKYYRNLARKNGFGNNRETSMECLAFDSLHKQAEMENTHIKYQEPTGDVHRDIFDDGGPDW